MHSTGPGAWAALTGVLAQDCAGSKAHELRRNNSGRSSPSLGTPFCSRLTKHVHNDQYCELSKPCCTLCIYIGLDVMILYKKPVLRFRNIADADVVVWAPHKFTLKLPKGNWVVDTIWPFGSGTSWGVERLWAK